METSKNKIIKYRENGEDKAFFIFITGDPRLYEVCDEPMPSGYYTTHSYYYSYDTLYEINTNGSMSDVLDSKYPIAANHGTLGAVNTGLSSYFWVYRDENTDSKRDSLTVAADSLWASQQ
ncbi:hypothetical protein LAG90_12080 [Marinilongibacter aquaticus]|uniref:hypothetical protein n=1 Tax=Marinilongibacter aquaticus TaxID=2975157 RepID=UPI0021BD47BD|nr:hypothetical protein [Marinilongibacter aquaticus]UBM57556.1 hypothetical protein LAG90_12080 [Marinilongibacter aquaticus]